MLTFFDSQDSSVLIRQSRLSERVWPFTCAFVLFCPDFMFTVYNMDLNLTVVCRSLTNTRTRRGTHSKNTKHPHSNQTTQLPVHSSVFRITQQNIHNASHTYLAPWSYLEYLTGADLSKIETCPLQRHNRMQFARCLVRAMLAESDQNM